MTYYQRIEAYLTDNGFQYDFILAKSLSDLFFEQCPVEFSLELKHPSPRNLNRYSSEDYRLIFRIFADNYNEQLEPADSRTLSLGEAFTALATKPHVTPFFFQIDYLFR